MSEFQVEEITRDNGQQRPKGLTRDQILAARAKRAPVPVSVPDWGGIVYVKTLTVAEQQALQDQNPDVFLALKVLVAAIVNEDGTRVFEEGDEEVLKGEHFPVAMTVFAEAARVNGLSSEELEEAVRSFEKAAPAASPIALR